MQLRLPIRRIFKPSALAMIAVAGSLGAWLFPTFGVLHKGFENAAKLEISAVIILVCWYLVIFLSFIIGQMLGSLWSPSRQGKEKILEFIQLDSIFVYLSYTAVGCLGLGSMLWMILHNMTPVQAILFISLGQTNALKESIYLDYHVGLVSLRYAVLYPGSIALYRIICKRQLSVLNVFNVLLIFLASFLSSRLLFMAALITTAFLVTFGKEWLKLRVWKVGVAAGCVFLLLGVLNISRNADFYERNHLPFALAGLNEIVAYLGTPFQVALGTANITGQIAAEGFNDPTPYRKYVDIAVNYNTNSAFVALHEQMGHWSWPYVAMLCSSMGAIFTFLKSFGRTCLLLPCGAILYASSEMWRLDLFQQGTFIVWFVVGLGVPATYAAIRLSWRFINGLAISAQRSDSKEV